MYCESCDNYRNYIVEEVTITKRVKELDVTIDSFVAKCMKCNEEVFVEEIDFKTQDLLFDEYRRKKEILTKEQIIDLREDLGISQRDFSRLLGLGEISISRYELGSLPTKKTSDLIKSIKDAKILAKLFDENGDKLSKKASNKIQEYIKEESSLKYSGDRHFNKEKFDQLSTFFVNLIEEIGEVVSITKLNKLLFYSDFNFYKKFGTSITGTIYMRFNYGPVPKKFHDKIEANRYLVQSIEDDKYVIEQSSRCFFDSLSNEEKLVARTIFKRFKKMSAREISENSHKEKGWIETKPMAPISYEFSQDLNIIV